MSDLLVDPTTCFPARSGPDAGTQQHLGGDVVGIVTADQDRGVTDQPRLQVAVQNDETSLVTAASPLHRAGVIEFTPGLMRPAFRKPGGRIRGAHRTHDTGNISVGPRTTADSGAAAHRTQDQ